MKACGLIVEYNPFHNGHVYHMNQAKKITKADCMITIMSGSFLQRGEPAIIDKFHRTKAALRTGIDIVIELPYVYAVQNSDIFASGAVQILNQIGVSTICFGSESGNVSYFIKGYENYKEKEPLFKQELKFGLAAGLSFPEASKLAYQRIGLTTDALDLARPNNILGFSYVKAIMDQNLAIKPFTIQRTKNDFHDQVITDKIASATSIRKNLIENNEIDLSVKDTMPKATIEQLHLYKESSGLWHTWEHYFQLLQYRVLTMSLEELREIHGVNEGIEHRIIKTATKASSIHHWIELIKTKRYTWTRIQRIFTHILTNTTKKEVQRSLNNPPPYIRILGLSKNGQAYLNKKRKEITAPIIFGLKRNTNPMLVMEERATKAYYSVLNPNTRNRLFHQEITGPIISHKK
ncbi:nucleotidyltransferase [Oceanobacillus sp. Castelsardo]|uniref:nucleotidyltransferase n=1 Tax=Oceanobacillus sp. Castelsardo TaxID=1851204 RepID=UPI000839B045|nr:nucleotidyltransferase [Oceanobacillus sp. Castelsardo]